MNTKEKLELLWKYLFLAVIAAGIFRFTDRHHPPSSFPLRLAGNHDMLFVGDDDRETDKSRTGNCGWGYDNKGVDQWRRSRCGRL